MTGFTCEGRQVAELTGRTVLGLTVIHGGRNSRLFRVETDQGPLAVKCYFRDGTARQSREWAALTLMKRGSLALTAEPVARRQGLSVFSFLPGRAAVNDGRPESVEPFLAFLKALNGLRGLPAARSIGGASEDLRRPEALADQVEARLGKLSKAAESEPELSSFLRNRLIPAWRARSPALKALAGQPPSEAVLSPSDFGFHNAVMGPDGLKFVDFEHFGWDDPAKLLIDTLIHPHENMKLSPPQKERFSQGFFDLFGEAIRERYRLLKPLLAVKWSLILLNEFLPNGQARRDFAGGGPLGLTKAAQLAKARAMIEEPPEF